MLLTKAAYAFALKKLPPSRENLPNKLPTSENNIGRFIEVLSTNDVCALKEAPHSGLQRLICRGDTSVADDMPNYALIIAAYCAMFHRRDFGLAESLLRVLKSRHMSFAEESAVKVLEAAYRAMATCDARAVCKVPATHWGALFKELVLLHFTYDKRVAKRLKCKTAKAFDRYEIYDSRVGWYTEYVPDPRLYFIFHAVDRVEPLPACQPRT
jgi:hypothetical protein